MINFQPFQILYTQLKGTDARLYEAMDRISMYLNQLADSANVTESKLAGTSSDSFPNILSADITGGALALTTAQQYIPGAFLLLNKNGPWLILGIFDFNQDTAGGSCLGQLEFNGLPIVPNAQAALDNTSGIIRASVMMGWPIKNTGNSYAKLMAAKSVNAGASFVELNTRIIAVYLG